MSNRRSTIILSLCILTFTITVSAVGLWKYAYDAYNGLDLAIYTNVLYNLSFSPSLGEGELEGLGRWYSSIQGHSYLGDHVEPILLLLVPLFRLWPDARLLIIVQALVLGLSAVPLYVLLRPSGIDDSRVVRGGEHPNAPNHIRMLRMSLRHAFIVHRSSFIVALYLLNPLLWNAALFEFHALAFAPVFLLSAAVAYQRRRFGWFLLWALLACAVREDVGLIVGMFGLVETVRWWCAKRGLCRSRHCESAKQSHTVQYIERREIATSRTPRNDDSEAFHRGLLAMTWQWIVVPVLLGLTWFLVATHLAASANPSGNYAFRAYYAWLLGGADGGVGMMVWHVLAHPLQVLRTVIGIPFFDGVLGLLLPFAFLPLLRPRWLLLALPPFTALALSRSGLSGIVVTLHYGLLFLPALVIASADAIAGMIPSLPVGGGGKGGWAVRVGMWMRRQIPIPQSLSIALCAFLILSSSFLLGPFRGIADIVTHGASAEYRARRAAYDDLLARVPRDAVVCAHAHALTALAARTTVCNLSYALLGIQQFGRSDYALPANLAYMLLDPAELQEDAMVYPNIPYAAEHAADMEPRLRGAVAHYALRVVAERDGIVLLERDGAGTLPSDEFFAAATTPRRGYRMPAALRDLRVVQVE